jgi:hypothetical protein
MRIGMLWFDNSSAPVVEKVARAVAYYTAKYGKRPDCCYVHPSAPPAEKIGEITVKTSRQVMPGYMWVGREEA